MKKYIASLATAAVATFGFAAPAATAGDGEGGSPCVNRAEYRSIVKGMRKARVHRIFDSPGNRLWVHSDSSVTRAYGRCGRHLWNIVLVWYERPRAGAGAWRAVGKDYTNLA
jgi:hypothetical protein